MRASSETGLEISSCLGLGQNLSPDYRGVLMSVSRVDFRYRNVLVSVPRVDLRYRGVLVLEKKITLKYLF